MNNLQCSRLGKIFALFLLVICFFNFGQQAVTPVAQEKKKKIIIFTSKGGAGHMAACKTLEVLLGDKYEIKIINPLATILRSLDFVRSMTFRKLDGEQFYNKLMLNGWMGTINNIIVPMGMNSIHRNRKKIERKFYNFLQQEKPDLLLSLIPLINYSASMAAKRSNIPFMLMTLDLDIYTWLMDLNKCTHPTYAITVVQKTPRIMKQLADQKIPESRIKEVGFHVRKDFYEAKNKAKICQDWNIPTNKPIIMLLMGGAGSNQIITYTKELAKLDTPAHLVVCIGRNQKQAKLLNKIKLNKNISMTIVPFTTRISDLMFVSDLFITKPGPNSCYEAVHYGIPTLIDGISKCLFWELASIDLVKAHGLGEVISKKRNIRPLVKKYLRWPSVPKVIDLGTADRFDIAIKKVIHDLIYPNNS